MGLYQAFNLLFTIYDLLFLRTKKIMPGVNKERQLLQGLHTQHENIQKLARDAKLF